jgi:hypothetical protein
MLWLVPAIAAATAPDGPLRVRNLAPAAFLYGLPAPYGATLVAGQLELALHVEHANNFTAGAGADTTAYFDGSTTVTSLALRRGWPTRWEAGVEIPLVHHGGGFTDGFVDDFHDLFGFPDGGRSGAPRNRLDYRIVSGDDTLVDVGNAGRDLGDVRLWGGYRLIDTPARTAAARLQLKLPTGDLDELSGSQAADLALWLELADRGWLRAIGSEVTLMAGVTLPGNGELLGDRQRDAVFSGHLGLQYPLLGRVLLHAQLDGHSEVLDTGIRQLGGAALQGTLGVSVGLPAALRLDLSLSEDLITKSAPDVVFNLSLSRRW